MADDNSKPATQVAYVQALTEAGFRRIGRWFGQEMTEVQVTNDELRALMSAPTQLLVLKADMKAKRDQVMGLAAPSLPSPSVSPPAPKPAGNAPKS